MADSPHPSIDAESSGYHPTVMVAPPRFVDRLRAAIGADTLGGSKRFAKDSGLSPGYICEILQGSKLPARDRMGRALMDGGFDQEEQEELLLLLSRDKVLADPEAEPFIALVRSTLEQADAAGVPIPEPLRLLLGSSRPYPVLGSRTTRLARMKPAADRTT
jgi:hypothetical protein